MLTWVSEHRFLRGFPGGEDVGRIEVLETPCDLLIPAALEGQINAANAALLDCELVFEAANGPTTPEADEILAERGIEVIPDVLVNAGGVTVSYFEWVQDRQKYSWQGEDDLDCSMVTQELLAEVRRHPAAAARPRPTTTSAFASPSRFFTATRTPPRLSASPAKKFASTVVRRPPASRSCPLRTQHPRPAARPAAGDQVARTRPRPGPRPPRTPRSAASARTRRSRRTASPACPADRPCRRTPPPAARRRTRPPPPGRPAPSPFTSPTAARAPPRKFGSSIPKKSAISAEPVPAVARRTRGPPPSSGVTTRSATPVPVQVAGGDEHPAGERRLERRRRRTARPASPRRAPGPASAPPGPVPTTRSGDPVAVEVGRPPPAPRRRTPGNGSRANRSRPVRVVQDRRRASRVRPRGREAVRRRGAARPHDRGRGRRVVRRVDVPEREHAEPLRERPNGLGRERERERPPTAPPPAQFSANVSVFPVRHRAGRRAHERGPGRQVVRDLDVPRVHRPVVPHRHGVRHLLAAQHGARAGRHGHAHVRPAALGDDVGRPMSSMVSSWSPSPLSWSRRGGCRRGSAATRGS